VRQLSEAAKRVLTQPEFVERQRTIGSDLSWSTPEELAGRLKADTAEALRIARDLKLTPGT
jgi:tripartite-type tricarboxylate transporter receptor subunit TctC